MKSTAGKDLSNDYLLGPAFDKLTLNDVLTTKLHSYDFNGSRANHINTRLRTLAFMFGVMTPTWIVVDMVALPPKQAYPIILLRLVVAALFLVLGVTGTKSHNLKVVRIRFALLFLVAALFYVASRLILQGQVESTGILTGYSYLPFILVALLAIFPLTILEGATAAIAVTGIIAGVEGYLGTLPTVELVGKLWLVGLLSGIALTAEISQLLMLLRLHRQATLDPLTRLFNRRALLERLDQEIARSQRYERHLTVILFDLDKFKRINDQHGHLVGDTVLERFAELARQEVRVADVVGRYGGEEFLLVLPDTGILGAINVAERIRMSCATSPVTGKNNRPLKFTVSAGIAECSPTDTADTFFHAADANLYQAKKQGRNQIVAPASDQLEVPAK